MGTKLKFMKGIRSFVNGDVSNTDYVDGIHNLKALLDNPKPYQETNQRG
jgi:hypothetical protein